MLTRPEMLEPQVRNAKVAFQPAAWLAALGAAIFLFQVGVLLRWVTGPYFVATLPGPDKVSELERLYYLSLQIVVPMIAAAMIWHWLIRPWLREGRPTTNGRLIAAFQMIFFWDMVMNFSSTSLFYNSYFFNRGDWSLGSWPGWFSPDGNALPEPLFLTPPGYTALVFSQVLVVCWLLRLAKQRWPTMGPFSSIAFIVVGLTILDTFIEATLVRTGVYAYPGGISAVTLFAGKTYQFPMTESFFFGGLGVGATALLSYYRDADGKTWAEYGIEHIHFLGTAGREWLRFFAVFGFIHGAFLIFYALPNQALSLFNDPFPDHYPSYLENGMCVYGAHANQCPGPGVMMPRPPFRVVPGGVGLGAD